MESTSTQAFDWTGKATFAEQFFTKSNRARSGPIVFPARGYFVFPPAVKNSQDTTRSGQATEIEDERTRHANSCSDDIDSLEKTRQAKERAWEERRQQNEEERRRRLAKEREVASNGEIEWVRSGGLLRDACGRRDYARTECIRQELRLQKEEQLVMERWDSYESSWRSLLVSTDSITFTDIPWPVQNTPSTVRELTSAAISSFLLAPLRVRTNSVTKKERIRASFLRWHPDKISAVLIRVVEDDVDVVREGISAVLMCLKALQAAAC